MFIRLHKGIFVDAVIPSAVGTQPSASPGDVVWHLSGDINPSKVIQVTENMQAVDPLTGQPLFNADGSPQWQTTTVTNPDGTTSTVIVTQQVPQTVYLFSGPKVDSTQFMPADIQAALTAANLTYTAAGSLQEAQTMKVASLRASFAAQLAQGFTSSADGTSRTYGFAPSDEVNYDEQTNLMNAGKATWPTEWADIHGSPVALTQAQYTQLITDAGAFKWQWEGHLRAQAGLVMTATSETAVNAINW